MSHSHSAAAELSADAQNDAHGAPLSESQVCDFLCQQPDFFNRHPELLQSLRIPHSRGDAVSLVERQLTDLREQNRQLKQRISNLMSVAASNEHLYRVYGALNLRLLSCHSLADMMQAVCDAICGELGHASVTLSLPGSYPDLPAPCQSLDSQHPGLRQLLSHRFNEQSAYLGRLSAEEKQLLRLDDAVQSVALLRLDAGPDDSNQSEPLAVLAVGSLQAGHFQPQMGTLLITRLAEVIGYRLPQLLPPQSQPEHSQADG